MDLEVIQTLTSLQSELAKPWLSVEPRRLSLPGQDASVRSTAPVVVRVEVDQITAAVKQLT